MNCPYCGTQLPDNATYCGFCNNSLQAAQPQYQQPQYQQPQYQQSQPVYPPVTQQPTPVKQRENVIMGILGALIGSALGGLSIYLFLQMEIVASLSGLITAFCAIKGYELLGGKLSKFGAFICLVAMLITPWLAHEIYCATEIMNVYDGISFSKAFESVGEWVDKDVYTENLLYLYLFTLLGGGAMILNAFKTKK